jgi:putative copper export protein
LDLLILAFGTIHVLATSAWFGAMLYSLVVLQPRATLYFDRPEEFENFITAVSDGARWKVLAVAGLSALSGVAIALVTWPEENSTAWILLGALKVALLLLALAVFGYASWRLWPARVLATREEIPGFQVAFRRVGWAMLTLIGSAAVLGVAMRAL